MTRTYKKVHAGSPLLTNAHLNRCAAERAHKEGGLTAADIAKEWPEVWSINAQGQLSQKYDYELADGSGRLETNRRITEDSVNAAIAKYKARTAR